ncbi:electron transfer flavoprotein beta subunit [Thermosporothrix hazakensis]|jgi:electron transfer flavoprotein beta subunit|uniref:Electron transfer flavoprotein small subunit n=2 Tax=Thermosporothrix TaxID=768650 RepID=A0A326UQT5_THEHA|nr:electron transfer flavoprotein subunit beta/FixA family protein [Thermosporothrix hazakensis]PZW36399.1 electron transfer flavoprotein beta subunit [Thermosporothrix hazakensis]BBH88864.1 electron transfer flavoprotein subunit beta [Thermosporothrix sp. COM3]GCE47049.1 electron transfer flavoprotein subunit beta [Thermosporothrix hazakensis]
MKIIVCIKQVPDPNTTVSKLDPNTKRLVRTGVSLILDPGDESTISAAIKLRDTIGNSELIALSMGPASAQEGMRRALAMGCDRAILVTDDALAGSDALATARVLSSVIQKEGADLVFCSTESTDGYTGMVPGGIAEFLGIPQLTFAREIKVEGTKAVIKRVIPSGYQTVECQLPAVVTIASGSFEAIYPTMKGIMSAKRKPFSQLKLADLGLDAAQVGEQGAREKILSIGQVEARAAGQIIKDDGTAAQQIADFLQRYQLL